MTVIEYSPQALDDIDRLGEFLLVQDADTTLATTDIIQDGVMLLARHPEVGRPTTERNVRELVISRGNTGYIALYEFIEARNTVVILGLRHQREAGYE
ncbi:MAG: type II toxin-antitoxin system RelE/ParE family toxin [Methylophilaceae bacterium]